MLVCTVCSLWYPACGSDRLGICADCYTQNFAGAQPPLDVTAPSAREALDDYAMALNNPQLALTPRQHQAMQRVIERWAQEDTP